MVTPDLGNMVVNRMTFGIVNLFKLGRKCCQRILSMHVGPLCDLETAIATRPIGLRDMWAESVWRTVLVGS